MTTQARTLSNTLRELTLSELDNVGGGAMPGQGHDPVPPPGTPPQPLNPVAIASAAAGSIAAIPGALPGVIAATIAGGHGGLL